MSMQDPISDMLTRLRNASEAGLKTVAMPHSKLKGELARILEREGFIKGHETLVDGAKKTLVLSLKYGRGDKPVLQGVTRVSKPSLRRYVTAEELPRVLGGMGMAILSTSKGILTDREARKTHVGGEVLCHVW
ncbi:MAG TPA: 30S ribosomal protein S8 [Kiritimatiellia bacterium]|nr:30S ribosomal protein S8 [Kiritimatiellia bacterium]